MSYSLVDGAVVPTADARLPIDDVGLLGGWTVFETLRVVDGEAPLLAEHLARLAESAREASIPLPPNLPADVEILAGRATGESRIRITLSGSGRHWMTLEPVPSNRRGAPVRCVTGPHAVDPFLLGSVKHGSRCGWMAAVRKSGCDDVLMVDASGRFTEGTTCGVIAVAGGRLQSAPHDGRILPSTTVVDVIRVARELGIPVEWEGAHANGVYEGLYVASATRGLAPVVELDGRRLPAWEPIGRQLFAAL